MNRLLYKRNLRVSRINEEARTDPQALIAREEARFDEDVSQYAAALAEQRGRQLVLLAGPSSSGKTTTAHFLCDKLHALGRGAHVVSLDNFYRGRGLAPRLANGEFNYEALEALDLTRLQACMASILETGGARLPVYDFIAGRATGEDALQTGPDSVVLFEGIHAINPLFEQHLPMEYVHKIFVSTATPFYEGKEKVLARRDNRLMRRLLRDMRFRGSGVEETLDMWKQVANGERENIFPYVDTCEATLDTTYAYEPCVYAHELLPALRAVQGASRHGEVVRRLTDILAQFAPLPAALVPENSLLREFLGADGTESGPAHGTDGGMG
ncbi:MAG: nucleoside kinase [Oscillospiraceae bacterium]|nr:nucleoside kinase [Oscillospiraceae bacterium]